MPTVVSTVVQATSCHRVPVAAAIRVGLLAPLLAAQLARVLPARPVRQLVVLQDLARVVRLAQLVDVVLPLAVVAPQSVTT